jgi:biopolymer transport protein ExbB
VLEIILAGGWLMAPILLCSTLSVAIIIERFWTLRRNKVTPEDLASTVEDWAARHELDHRHIAQLSNESPLGRINAAALNKRKRSREIIKEAVEDTGRHVVHDLERFLNTLGTIAGISPLLGLLGTVIGMIEVFSAIMISGVGDANVLAGGISQALITTAAGLTVAIPSYFFYRFFRGMVAEYVISMEEKAIRLIDVIERGHIEPAGYSRLGD